MIPYHLERAIMNGVATYSKHTHAMGMYGNFTIPQGKLVIIIDIKWHNFINPYKNAAMLMKEWLKFNEYQMKIDGKKSVNYMTYRNNFSYYSNLLNSVQPDSQIATAFVNGFFTPNPPVIQDVYFVCEEFIKITISRNVYLDSFTSNYGVPSQKAAQEKAPNGVQNVPVLKRVEMKSSAPLSMHYTPPGNIDAGLTNPTGGRNYESYAQDLDPDTVGFLSQIYPPETGFNAVVNQPTLTQPLVEFGVVTINSNEFDKLANS